MASPRKGPMSAAVLSGVGAALVLLAMPIGLVELLVASSGLSEAFPAAAPPLGLKARLLLSAFGALMAVGFTWSSQDKDGAAASRRDERGRPQGVQGVNEMGFALSKLGWLGRGRSVNASRDAAPVLRRADAHPDAPARSPIYASRDFGGLEIFPRPASSRQIYRPDAERVQPSAALPRAASLSVVEEPGVVEASFLAQNAPEEETVDAEFEEIVGASTVTEAASHPNHRPIASSGPSTLAELTQRLERGLARRVRGAKAASDAAGVIADMPVEPAVAVPERVADDVDQALRAALGTLRSMAARR